jgi:hypothetical protein
VDILQPSRCHHLDGLYFSAGEQFGSFCLVIELDAATACVYGAEQPNPSLSAIVTVAQWQGRTDSHAMAEREDRKDSHPVAPP